MSIVFELPKHVQGDFSKPAFMRLRLEVRVPTLRARPPCRRFLAKRRGLKERQLGLEYD